MKWIQWIKKLLARNPTPKDRWSEYILYLEKNNGQKLTLKEFEEKFKT